MAAGDIAVGSCCAKNGVLWWQECERQRLGADRHAWQRAGFRYRFAAHALLAGDRKAVDVLVRVRLRHRECQQLFAILGQAYRQCGTKHLLLGAASINVQCLHMWVVRPSVSLWKPCRHP